MRKKLESLEFNSIRTFVRTFVPRILSGKVPLFLSTSFSLSLLLFLIFSSVQLKKKKFVETMLLNGWKKWWRKVLSELYSELFSELYSELFSEHNLEWSGKLGDKNHEGYDTYITFSERERERKKRERKRRRNEKEWRTRKIFFSERDSKYTWKKMYTRKKDRQWRWFFLVYLKPSVTLITHKHFERISSRIVLEFF